MSVTPDTIRIEPIVYVAQVEALRTIRNATAGSYSHDNGKIGYDRQQAWWGRMQGQIKGWLYYEAYAFAGSAYLSYRIAGFGILRRDDDERWWNSVGVLPTQQGFGWGSIITHDLIAKHDGPIFASVRKDNPAGLAMHHSDDWDRLDEQSSEDLIYFRSKGSVR